VDALPVGQRRTGDDDRPEQFGPHRGKQHDRPTGLAIADHAGPAIGMGMQRRDFLEEKPFGAGDVLDGLARHRVRQESNEITGMTGMERDADFAVGLEAADAGTVSGARIDDDKGPLLGVDLDALGRNDAHQPVIDGPFQPAAIHDQFGGIAEHIRRGLRHVFAVLIAALAHHVEKQHPALGGIDGVLDRRREETERRHAVAADNRRIGATVGGLCRGDVLIVAHGCGSFFQAGDGQKLSKRRKRSIGADGTIQK
jgi:hypothetical protein